MIHIQLLYSRDNGTVTNKGALKHIIHAVSYTLIDPLFASLGFHIILVGKIARQICGPEIHHLGIIERLDGFHNAVIHLLRCIHGDRGKCCRRCALKHEMLRFGIVVVGIGPMSHSGCLVAALEIGIAVVQPEGNIDASNLFHSVVFLKELGKQRLTLAQIQECRFRILLGFPEGENTVGFQLLADSAGKDRGVAAIGAECSSGVSVCSQFTTAGIADKTLHGAVFLLGKLIGCLRFPFNLLGRFFLGLTFVPINNGFNVESTVAVFAGHLLVFTAKNEAGSAAWTFIFQYTAGLCQCNHLLFLF